MCFDKPEASHIFKNKIPFSFFKFHSIPCLSLILGTITSENYPNSYPDNIDKEYPINADGTFVIKFSDFVLEV